MSSNIIQCDCVPTTETAKCNKIPANNIRFVGITKEQSTFLNDTDIWTRQTLNGTITVPEDKASIKKINIVQCTFKALNLKIISTPAIYTKNQDGTYSTTPVENFEDRITTGKKLIVEGEVAFLVEYTADLPDGSVVDFEDFIPFSAFMVLPADTKIDDVYSIKYTIDDVLIKELCDRSISLSLVVSLKANKLDEEVAEKVKNNDNNITNNNISGSSSNKCTSNLNYSNQNYASISLNDYSSLCTPERTITGEGTEEEIIDFLRDTNPAGNPQEWNEFSIYSEIPVELPFKNVKKILTIDSSVDILCQEIVDTAKPVADGVKNSEDLTLTGKKLIVQGILYEDITYIGESDCNSIHSINFSTPFTTYIILDNSQGNISNNSNYHISYVIEDVYMEALKDRDVFQNTTIFMLAKKIS